MSKKDDDDLIGVPKTQRSKLYKLLYKKLPNFRKADKEKLDVDKIATKMKMSSQGIYKWFWADRIPQGKVSSLLALDGSELKQKDLVPFVLG